MNENICVRLIVSETTWIRQEWLTVQTFQDTHEVLMQQFRCFAITIQRLVQFQLFIIAQRCIIPYVRFWWLCKQVLVNICVQECYVYVDRNCDCSRSV